MLGKNVLKMFRLKFFYYIYIVFAWFNYLNKQNKHLALTIIIK